MRAAAARRPSAPVVRLLLVLSACHGQPATWPDAGGPSASAALAAERQDTEGDDLPANSQPILEHPQRLDCRRLDLGIYWFGRGHRAQKAVPGTRSEFFNPAAPTLIYIHGWQRGAVQQGVRPDFLFAAPGMNMAPEALSDLWLERGWNFGALYWPQIADEDDIRDAEAKIWPRPQAALVADGLRWRQCDGSYMTAALPQQAMGEIAWLLYRQALSGYHGPGIRLVGHDLGAQIAIRLGALATATVDGGKAAAALVPKRIALIEPWWSMTPGKGAPIAKVIYDQTTDAPILVGPPPPSATTPPTETAAELPLPEPSINMALGTFFPTAVPAASTSLALSVRAAQPTSALLPAPWHGPVVNDAVRQLQASGVTFEHFRFSDLLAAAHGDANSALTALIGLVVRRPGFITDRNPTFELAQRHMLAPKLYLRDIAFAPPKGCAHGVCDLEAPSAATSDELTRTWMRSAALWEQSAGTKTLTPADDTYVQLD